MDFTEKLREKMIEKEDNLDLSKVKVEDDMITHPIDENCPYYKAYIQSQIEEEVKE